MARLLLARLWGVALVMLAASALCFGALALSPSDAATLTAASRTATGRPSPQQVAQVRAELGLDRPVAVQYLRWLARTLRGDLGRSYRTGVPVADDLGRRLPYTLALAGAATLVTSLIGLPAGVRAARGDRLTRRVLGVYVPVSVALPDFWVAFVLVLVFAVHWRWLPVYGAGSLKALVLPTAALALVRTGVLASVTRSSLQAVAREPYLQAARARGANEGRVWWRHALPNAALPVVTTIGAQFAGLATSAVVTETVFAWPGIGTFFVDAVAARDLPVIQACVLLFALTFSMINLLADLLYLWIDPRLRLSEAG